MFGCRQIKLTSKADLIVFLYFGLEINTELDNYYSDTNTSTLQRMRQKYCMGQGKSITTAHKHQNCTCVCAHTLLRLVQHKLMIWLARTHTRALQTILASQIKTTSNSSLHTAQVHSNCRGKTGDKEEYDCVPLERAQQQLINQR